MAESTTSPTAPATAPPAQDTPPTPPPATRAATEDYFMNGIMRDLGILEKEPDTNPVVIVDDTTEGMTIGEVASMAAQRKEEKARKAAQTPAPDPTPAAAPVASPTASATETQPPAPATPQKVIVRPQRPIEKIVEDVVARSLPPAQPAQPAPAHTPSPVQRDPIEDQLTDMERDELEIARYAAQKDPAKYGDMPNKLVKFYKGVTDYLEKKSKDDPDFDPDSKEVQEHIISMRPQFSPSEMKRIERQKIREEAVAEAEQKTSGRLREIEDNQRRIEITPKIERAAEQFARTVEDSILETPAQGQKSLAAEIVEQARTKGWKTLVEEDPVLAPLVQRAHQTAVSMAQNFLQVSTGVRQIDVSKPEDANLLTFLIEQGKHFKKTGGELLQREFPDGVTRTFLPLNELGALRRSNPEAAKRHWTFDDSDVLELISKHAKLDAEQRVQTVVANLQKAGYDRKQAAPAAGAPPVQRNGHAPEPAPVSPRSVTTSAPGPSIQAPASQANGAFSDSELKTLFPDFKMPA